jgi:hypothetical protein
MFEDGVFSAMLISYNRKVLKEEESEYAKKHMFNLGF